MKRPQFTKVAALLANGVALACFMNCCGCGESGTQVVPFHGRVTIDGEPLSHGFVRFVPKGGRTSDAELNSDGTFELRYSADKRGAEIGSHRVEVAANETLGPTRVKWHAPKQYASIATSGLTHEVVGPEDDMEIKLTWGSQQGPIEEVYSAAESF